MKTLLVIVGLLSVLAYPIVEGVPVNSNSSEESKEVSDESNESASNESVYLIKEVSYEVGVVDTVALGNSSEVVIVQPEDRIETDDVALWTSKNDSSLENETTTGAAPAVTTLVADLDTEEHKTTTSSTDQKPTVEDGTPINKTSSV